MAKEILVKERGVIFNGEMVRAILDGRKTQTRRAVKASASDMLDLQEKYPHKKYNIGCPLGQPGDRLWVRETHSIRTQPTDQLMNGAVWYRESDIGRSWDGEIRWRPSIHMPRWASRITLEITGVRVERLNDISQEDAEAEGLERTNFTGFGDDPGMPHFPEPDVYRGTKEHGWTECPGEAFQHLWQSIYGEEDWQANPWVWVIEFKRIDAA